MFRFCVKLRLIKSSGHSGESKPTFPPRLWKKKTTFSYFGVCLHSTTVWPCSGCEWWLSPLTSGHPCLTLQSAQSHSRCLEGTSTSSVFSSRGGNVYWAECWWGRWTTGAYRGENRSGRHAWTLTTGVMLRLRPMGQLRKKMIRFSDHFMT